jgi:hypothetical protein
MPPIFKKTQNYWGRRATRDQAPLETEREEPTPPKRRPRHGGLGDIISKPYRPPWK